MGKRSSIPWFTILIALLCIGMYFWQFYLRATNHLDLEIYTRLGAPSTLKLYQGHFWGVFWNSFLHSAWQLLAFNLIGIVYFGSIIERKTNFLTLFILGFLASTITSLVQLGLTDDAGIGMTGANYFFMSYIIGRSIKDESFKIPFRIPIFISGLLFIGLFIFLNSRSLTNFGIESMLAGLVFGFITGFLVGARLKIESYSFVLISLIGLGSTLFYAPWSVSWNLKNAIESYEKDDYKSAKHFYNRIQEISPGNPTAINNLRIIKIEELSDKAFDIHEKGDYIGAHAVYDEILELDPENDWAKDQIDKLP